MTPAHAVEEAVRRYWQAVERGDPHLDHATGPLGAFLDLAERAPRPGTHRTEIGIDRLEVTRVEGDEASCDFGARERVTFELDDGRQTVEMRLTGPLIARRVGGEWKVADYGIDGRSFAEAFVPLDSAPAGENGVRLAARGLLLLSWTSLFLEVENTGDEPLELRWAMLKCCYSGLTRTTVEPGERVVVRTDWTKRLLRARTLRIFVHGRAAGSNGSFTFGALLRPRTREAVVTQLRRLPVALWLQLQAGRALAVLGLPGLVAVLAWMLTVGNYRAVGALLSLLGAGGLHESYDRARLGHRRASRIALAAGLALLAAGIPLFVLNR